MITEIIVIDNNSSDSSCDMLRITFPNVKLIRNVENKGFSKANNQGAAIAKGEYILILNPDTVLGEETLDELVDFADRKNNLGAVGAQFIDGNGNFLPECKRNFPTIRIAFKKLLGNSKKYYAHNLLKDEIGKVDILTGAFMLMYRLTYLQVGGFDEDYFMYGEDIDLSYKLIKNDFVNYYLGSSKIIHYKGESTINNRITRDYFYSAMRLFYTKHFKNSSKYSFFTKAIVKLLVLLNTNEMSIKNKENKLESLLFISNDQHIFNKILKISEFNNSKMDRFVPENCSGFDIVIFDNNWICNSEIIKYYQAPNLSDISKRIIPKGTQFFIGSDSDSMKGAEIEF